MAHEYGDVAPDAPVAGPSIRDILRERIKAQIKPQPITINVPETPGLLLTFTGDISPQRFAEVSRQVSVPDDPYAENLRVSLIMLAETCIAIHVDGTTWQDKLGRDVTFASAELHELTGTPSHADSVGVLFANDLDVITAFEVVAENAGLKGGRVRPTKRP